MRINEIDVLEMGPRVALALAKADVVRHWQAQRDRLEAMAEYEREQRRPRPLPAAQSDGPAVAYLRPQARNEVADYVAGFGPVYPALAVVTRPQKPASGRLFGSQGDTGSTAASVGYSPPNQPSAFPSGVLSAIYAEHAAEFMARFRQR